MTGNKDVNVKIAQDGSVFVSGRNGFHGNDERVVECTEEFYEALN